MSFEKKQMVIALTAVLLLAGLRKEGCCAANNVVKFSLQFKGNGDQNVNQNVISDPNENIVTYHVTKADQDSYIVQDFNKGLQTVRIQSPAGTTCYVTPLDLSTARSPALITGPDSVTDATDKSDSHPLVMSDTPIANSSFLTQKAAELCSGVSVYWATKDCGGEPIGTDATILSSRRKRALYQMNPHYGLPGVGGCCDAYWACRVQAVEYIIGNLHRCEFTLTKNTCCGVVAQPYCSNSYYARWATPGLRC